MNLALNFTERLEKFAEVRGAIACTRHISAKFRGEERGSMRHLNNWHKFSQQIQWIFSHLFVLESTSLLHNNPQPAQVE